MVHLHAPFHALWQLGIVPTAREFVDPQKSDSRSGWRLA